MNSFFNKTSVLKKCIIIIHTKENSQKKRISETTLPLKKNRKKQKKNSLDQERIRTVTYSLDNRKMNKHTRLVSVYMTYTKIML